MEYLPYILPPIILLLAVFFYYLIRITKGKLSLLKKTDFVESHFLVFDKKYSLMQAFDNLKSCTDYFQHSTFNMTFTGSLAEQAQEGFDKIKNNFSKGIEKVKNASQYNGFSHDED
jgi:hypothetical protein